MTELTPQEKELVVQILMNGRYTPNEWETIVKPIVTKLQEKDELNAPIPT
jgi:hypothetical protein